MNFEKLKQVFDECVAKYGKDFEVSLSSEGCVEIELKEVEQEYEQGAPDIFDLNKALPTRSII